MKETVNAFLQHLVVERGFSQNTLDAYSNDLNQFREFVSGQLDVSDDDTEAWRMVDLDLLNAYISELRDTRGYRDSTTARKVAAVRSFFGYLSANDLINEDPTENLGSPRVGRSVPKFISEADVQLLLSTAADTGTPEGRRDASILELLYATGVRVSELVALNVQDIDFEEGFIRAWGKGAKERIVYLYPEALSNLRGYIGGARAELVSNKKGETALYVNNRGRAAHPPMGVEHPEDGGEEIGRGRKDNAPHAATQLRHSPAPERGIAAARAGTAGTLQHLNHPGVHPPHGLPRAR